ncbi:MAG: YbjN domain-containing protein [Proteobacteria bacterium]|nr:YbjN domain-containing protein [Pseudomonadota bacterium]
MSLSIEMDDVSFNPLDRVERLAERMAWTLDRTSSDEVVMGVTGGWSDLTLSLNWRDDLESLLCMSAYELKVPQKRQDEIARLLNLINAQLIHGHFDFWLSEGSIVFRSSLLLAGAAEANDSQCEGMIRIAVESCQRYYPAIQFVIWAGHTAEQALDSALLDTRGEA